MSLAYYLVLFPIPPRFFLSKSPVSPRFFKPFSRISPRFQDFFHHINQRLLLLQEEVWQIMGILPIFADSNPKGENDQDICGTVSYGGILQLLRRYQHVLAYPHRQRFIHSPFASRRRQGPPAQRLAVCRNRHSLLIPV